MAQLPDGFYDLWGISPAQAKFNPQNGFYILQCAPYVYKLVASVASLGSTICGPTAFDGAGAVATAGVGPSPNNGAFTLAAHCMCTGVVADMLRGLKGLTPLGPKVRMRTLSPVSLTTPRMAGQHHDKIPRWQHHCCATTSH
jgi:hypothetical protein